MRDFVGTAFFVILMLVALAMLLDSMGIKL